MKDSALSVWSTHIAREREVKWWLSYNFKKTKRVLDYQSEDQSLGQNEISFNILQIL